MTNIHAPDTPKMLRETLCTAQTSIPPTNPRRPEHIHRLQRLIDDIDRQRPLGPDGKHGNRHTDTCGCADKPAKASTGRGSASAHLGEGDR